MSYTLKQVELYALSETRRISIYDRIREVAVYEKGQYMSLDVSVSLIREWAQDPTGKLTYNRHAAYGGGGKLFVSSAEFCLDGATVDEYQLYTCIEIQRIRIRQEENRRRVAETSVSVTGDDYLRALRSDFKSLLKEVQL